VQGVRRSVGLSEDCTTLSTALGCSPSEYTQVMVRHSETLDQQATLADTSQSGQAQPGLVLIFSAGEPLAQVIPFGDGPLKIGRETLSGLRDPLLSRRHASIALDGRRFSIRDLDSRNGTAVDGAMLTSELCTGQDCVVRTGGTIFLLRSDIRPYMAGVRIMEGDGMVMGPSLQEAWQVITRAARFGHSLHVHGESGVGKELAAQAFHRLGPNAAGPFVAVNCAAIPEGVAERLLFGTRKGAYSGASLDAEGYLQAAHGGTLFLDEVAELDLQVQSKLLRVLETREVLPLGATKPRALDLRLCSATHKNLRAEVAKGRLREDLYFRIGRPQIDLPPLRKRREEVSWLVGREVKNIDRRLIPHVSLVETCLLRQWPGNVRELISEVRTAAQAALFLQSPEVRDQHLSPSAGWAFAEETRTAEPPSDLERQVVEKALHEAAGNVSQAARALGMHRTQLRRLLDRHGMNQRRLPSRRGPGVKAGSNTRGR